MLIDYLAACGTKVYFGDLSDVIGGDSADLLLSFLQGMDKYFLTTLRKNTIRGLTEAREKHHHLGRVPAGFRLVEKKRLEVEPWARDVDAMRERKMTTSAIKRVQRNVDLFDHSRLESFLKEQYESSFERYQNAKAKRDADAHAFEVELAKMRPVTSERASL